MLKFQQFLYFAMSALPGELNSLDLPSTDTVYGKAFTWDEKRSIPQSNLAEFLNKLACDTELQEKIKNVQSQQEVIDIASEYGMDFTVDTLESRARTLPHIDEDSLQAVRWARWGESKDDRRWAMNIWIKL